MTAVSKAPRARTLSRFFAGLAAAACCLGVATRSSAAERYDIRPQLRPGTAWVFTHSNESTMTQKATANGQVLETNETTMSQKREGAMVVKDASRGLPTAAEVTFGKECSTVLKQNGQEQNTPFPLIDRTVSLRREADGRITANAGRDVDPKVAAEAGQLLDINTTIYPPEAVAVGDEWSPDTVQLRQQFQVAPEDRFSIRCKLLAVGAVRGRKTYDVQTIASLAKNQPGSSFKMTLASVTQVDILTGLPIQSEAVVKLSINGEQQVQGQNGPSTVNIASEGQIRIIQLAMLRDEAAQRPVAEAPAPLQQAEPAREQPTYGSTPTPAPLRQVENPARQDPPAAEPSASPYAGAFKGEALSGQFQVNGARVSGSITLANRIYPVAGVLRDGKMVGNFQAGSDKFSFTATIDGENLQFASEGNQYTMKRLGGGTAVNPLARARNPLE